MAVIRDFTLDISHMATQNRIESTVPSYVLFGRIDGPETGEAGETSK